ncbi:MAG: class I SAM-dependent methyltransferase [Firmicutes bacterium]|nr:class I SAM-dependent methyltransferase [Bacillota bacterium]
MDWEATWKKLHHWVNWNLEVIVVGTIKKSLAFAQELIRGVLLPGEHAIDATAGNGHDTVFLSSLVGRKGLVWAFDIQEKALLNTAKRLERKGLRQRVRLIQQGHERMATYVPGPVGAIMFNLGYLPGGDHTIVTQPDTTIAALESGLKLLRPGGIITLVIYTGHPGGKVEGVRLEKFSSTISPRSYHVLSYRFLNQQNHPPYLLAIEKR